MKRRTLLRAGGVVLLSNLLAGCVSKESEVSGRVPERLVERISARPAIPATYLTRSYSETRDQAMTYYLYLPDGYDPRKKYPLVLLLHGGGESALPHNSAAQNRALLMGQHYVQIWGPGYPGQPMFSVQRHWPSFIVVPQVTLPQRWVDVPASQGSYVLAPQPDAALRTAKAIVDALQRSYGAIDRTRLYITGLSMGGYGTWEAIERWPDYFAAAAPLSGAGDPALAARLIHLPIWAFQGSADTIVPPDSSRAMIAALRAAGGQPRYTEYAGAGHPIWDMVYAPQATLSPSSQSLFSWLFAQRKHAEQVHLA